MRPIEFRVWDYSTNSFLSSGRGAEYEEQDGVYYNLGTPYEFSQILANPIRFLIQQFTGLLDKKGNKIFEGDLVKTGWHTNPSNLGLLCKVIYWKNGFYLEYQNVLLGDTIYQLENCEVVGFDVT